MVPSWGDGLIPSLMGGLAGLKDVFTNILSILPRVLVRGIILQSKPRPDGVV